MSTAEPSGAIETVAIEDTSLLAFYRDMNQPERERVLKRFREGLSELIAGETAAQVASRSL